VAIAVRELEGAGLLTWVHRLTKIRRREQDLFGHWGSAWQVIRTSNGYSFVDPLEREPGRRVWCSGAAISKPESPFWSDLFVKKRQRHTKRAAAIAAPKFDDSSA
jgi:hypothetical protein